MGPCALRRESKSNFRGADHLTEWRSLRSQRHLYIEYTNGRRIRFRELYNLKRDPWQLRNLLHRNPDRYRDIATRLHRRLVRRAHCKGTACF